MAPSGSSLAMTGLAGAHGAKQEQDATQKEDGAGKAGGSLHDQGTKGILPAEREAIKPVWPAALAFAGDGEAKTEAEVGRNARRPKSGERVLHAAGEIELGRADGAGLQVIGDAAHFDAGDGSIKIVRQRGADWLAGGHGDDLE